MRPHRARPALVLGMAAVTAVWTATVPAQAASVEHAHWGLNESTGVVAHDDSGFGNHGTSHDVLQDGEAYTFNGTSSRVIVPDSHSLDPGAASFSFGMTLSMSQPPDYRETYDVLRKGTVKTAGGSYKLEIKHVKGRAVARCVVKDGSKVLAAIQSQATVAGDLASGQPRTVACTRTATGVTVQVGGLAPRTKSAATGSVSNAAPLAIGAKAEDSGTGYDWYRGKVHDAWVSVDE